MNLDYLSMMVVTGAVVVLFVIALWTNRHPHILEGVVRGCGVTVCLLVTLFCIYGFIASYELSKHTLKPSID